VLGSVELHFYYAWNDLLFVASSVASLVLVFLTHNMSGADSQYMVRRGG
jgi:hypothetical protein